MSVESKRLSSTADHPRPAGRRSLLMIPLLSALFGVVSGVTIGAVVPMAVFGLGWGVVLAMVAPRIARYGSRLSLWTELPLYLTMSLSFIVLGGALLGDFLASTPQEQLQILQFGRFGLYFAAIHVLFELILMPLVVMLNWYWPHRRKLVIAAAVAFYLGRLASAVYFAPNAIAWGNDPSLATLDDVQRCMDLNLVRTVGQDAVTAIFLLLASVLPGQPQSTAAVARGLELAPS